MAVVALDQNGYFNVIRRCGKRLRKNDGWSTVLVGGPKRL